MPTAIDSIVVHPEALSANFKAATLIGKRNATPTS